jgi:hypothetical protein
VELRGPCRFLYEVSIKPRWPTPEEVAEQLALEVEEVHRLLDALEIKCIELPDGRRRIDPESYRCFLRARVLGHTAR